MPTKTAKVREINTPALLLLMTSSSRMFLRYICGPLKFLVQASKSHQGSVSLGPGYRELEAAFQRSPVTISQFEHLLLQVDTRIKSAYQSSAISTDDRGITEKEMLIKAEIPNVLLGPAKEILTSIAASLKEEVNVAELYFANTASLHLTNDQSSKRWRKEHPIDAMRKIEIRNDARTKKCTKCGAVMEDLLPHKGMNSIVINFHKHCFCGSWWMVGSEDEGNDQGF